MNETSKIYHRCPECGYIVTDLEFRLSIIDFPCRCNKTHLSSFEIVKINEDGSQYSDLRERHNELKNLFDSGIR